METREILYFSGIVEKKDTIHVFVNHWPSRYQGLLETQSGREVAANLLKSKVAELNRQFKNPKIIILGDFNDRPTDNSIFDVLVGNGNEDSTTFNALCNLSEYWRGKYPGTIKYQSQWSFFDQIIVSENWLKSTSGFSISPENAVIVNPSYLLEKDEKYGGTKPFRTYNGFSYHGGFSDHLPVLLRINSVN